MTSPPVFDSMDIEELLLPILERLEKKDFDLPILPQVASQVLVLTTDPEVHASKLTTLLQQDPVLTAKIFKAANSAGSGTSRQIESLAQALAWLGFNSISGMAFALSVQSGTFNTRGYENEVRALWTHALATAFYAKAIAGMLRHNQETAFLCGLLHSIGKPFVVHTFNQSRSTSAAPLPWSGMSILLDQSYVEAGRQLALEWNFPASVKETITLHQHQSYHLATDPTKGSVIACFARNLATYYLDSVVVTKEMLRMLPVVQALEIPEGVMDGILEMKEGIQAQTDSLLI